MAAPVSTESRTATAAPTIDVPPEQDPPDATDDFRISDVRDPDFAFFPPEQDASSFSLSREDAHLAQPPRQKLPRHWQERLGNRYPDDTLVLALEPPQNFYGFTDLQVDTAYAEGDDVVITGTGFASGKSRVRPLSLTYRHVQTTHLPVEGDTRRTVSLPGAVFTVGLRADSLALDSYTYTLRLKREKFMSDMESIAEDLGTTAEGELAVEEPPDVDETTDPRELEAYAEEYGALIERLIGDNDLIGLLATMLADKLSELNGNDYFETSQTRSTENVVKLDLPLGASVGTWDHADGGEFFKGRLGIGESIRLGARTGPTLVLGMEQPTFYWHVGIFLDASLATLYFADHDHPGIWDLKLRLGQDVYINPKKSDVINDFAGGYAGLAVEAVLPVGKKKGGHP